MGMKTVSVKLGEEIFRKLQIMKGRMTVSEYVREVIEKNLEIEQAEVNQFAGFISRMETQLKQINQAILQLVVTKTSSAPELEELKIIAMSIAKAMPAAVNNLKRYPEIYNKEILK
ncbi:MAG: hypothetical protein HYS21_13160 [Deltaproteobacteria bacterium]|nr:hypothetical protein [Deltaproteobacteria bacterium]